ncbi:MAG: DUF4065 domain-containing protein [Candidatus Muirbacterium halophilum]|nr:DUF4065 domain-containing protein [Candidatus Muirbacterium halophilum]MCK9477215.1 DUF4065 domain-containing protein [Candidatus Muirbacterium halophilum]
MSENINICPFCETNDSLKIINKIDMLNIRGEDIGVDTTYYKCNNCENEFEINDLDKYDLAYRKYREKHGWLQPEDIKSIRKKYKLNQKEFSDILGIGEITLSRYENGALQDKVYETLLRLANDPIEFLNMVSNSDDFLSDKKKHYIIEQLQEEIRDKNKIFDIIKKVIKLDNINEFSGNIPFDIDKLVNLIVFLCKDGILKTVLNKLLFYCDFSYYKNFNCSITGSSYVHNHYGPVVDKFEYIFAGLVEGNFLEYSEVIYPNGYTGELYTSKRDFDVKLFDDNELEIIINIKKQLGDKTAKELTELSHEELCYKKTDFQNYISYEHAKDLNF